MAELIGGEVGGVIGFEEVSSSRAENTLSVEGARQEGERSKRDSKEVLYGDSSQFQVVMKQLGKRDTTTKLKV